jgi:hypothetical protein
VTGPEVLLAAADHIERHGLAKGVFADDDGRCCTRGAILVVTDGTGSGPACDALGRSLGLKDHDLLNDIARWNDAPERTAPEVVAALRAAATS